MTREEAESLNIGDMVYIPERGTKDWPDSYDRIVGKTLPVVGIDGRSVVVKYENTDYYLYLNEVLRSVPEDLGDDFVDSDIKLLFGGDG